MSSFVIDNGKIDFEEFARVMARNYYKKHSRDSIKEAFRYWNDDKLSHFLLNKNFNIYKTNRKFDLNNSGNISSEELRVVLSKMHRFYSRDEVEDLIRKVDHNKDGLISIDEFAELLDLN